MLRIKLSRTGKKNQPSYRIVVQERRSKRDGRVVQTIGSYHPLTQPATIRLNKNAYSTWITNGAQPTDTVRRLARRA